jgi:hypothetical protein
MYKGSLLAKAPGTERRLRKKSFALFANLITAQQHMYIKVKEKD